MRRAKTCSRKVRMGAWPPLRRDHLFRAVALVLLFSFGVATDATRAQGNKKAIPKEEVHSLRTKDGVMIRCRFYPGTEGKKSAPVILVHGWEGKSADFRGLAYGLQRSYGCAVVVPDLRGHGGSTMRQVPGRPTAIEIRRQRMRAGDIRAMYQMDLEAVKKFLLQKHNDGELNIELLFIVGTDMGAVVAANWVAQDWSWPQLPTYKQGQDVKAFVLVSPPQTFKGVKLQQALLKSHPAVRGKLATMIVYGKRNARNARTAKGLHRSLLRYHERDSQDVHLVAVDTDLQGIKLLTTSRSKVAQQIASFIRRELATLRDQYSWEPRVNPLGS